MKKTETIPGKKSIKKCLILFLLLMLAGSILQPQAVHAQETEGKAWLGVSTWDNTTIAGTVSLDDGDDCAADGGYYEYETPSSHIVRAEPAPGYYFRGWHIATSESAARKNGIVSTANPYTFTFGYNLAMVHAPYYLIAEFAPLGDTFDDCRDPQTLTGTDWMAGISGDRYLHEINIPGTHDTFCKNVWCYHVFGSWFEDDAITQTMTLEEQLNAGVRLLDVRLTNTTKWVNTADGIDLRLCHGSYKADILDLLYFCINDDGCILNFHNAMAKISKFLRRHPSETIIITVKAEYDAEDGDGADVMKKLRNLLADYQDILYTEDRMPMLREVRGKAVILANDPKNKLGYGMRFGETESGMTKIGGREIWYENTYTLQKDEKSEAVQHFYSFHDISLIPNVLEHRTYGFLVYTSASSVPFHDNPTETANVVNQMAYFADDALFKTKGKNFGWVYSDFVTTDTIKTLWQSNFPDTLEYCTVTFKGTVNGEERSRSRKVLRGTTVPIMSDDFLGDTGSAGWLMDGELYTPGSGTIVVDRDMVFTPATTLTWDYLAGKISRLADSSELTITLPCDITAQDDDESIKIRWWKDITIDLNGHTLDAAAGKDQKRRVFELGAGGRLHLKNGTVTGGYEDSGGGIYVGDGTELTLENVTVTGNTATQYGGGIYVASGTYALPVLKVAGNTTVAGNTNGNVYLLSVSGYSNNPMIGFSGELTDGARIGVTLADELLWEFDPISHNQPFVFTSGLAGMASPEHFTSDNGNLVVSADGEAALQNSLHVVHLKNYRLSSSPDAAVGVRHGAKAYPLIPDTEPYYSFLGWYLDAEYTELYDFDTPVLEELTLYGRWEHYHAPMVFSLPECIRMKELGKPVEIAEEDVDIEPTCEQAGQRCMFAICPVDFALVDKWTETIDPYGHDWSQWETSGQEKTRICSRCGRTETVSLSDSCPHDMPLEAVAKVMPTCTAEGMEAHYRCSLCGQLFLDEAGTQAAEQEDLLIAPAGHDGVWETISKEEASCDVYGYALSVLSCQTCGSILENHTEYTQMTGHQWEETAVLLQETCTGTGLHEQTCTVCGARNTVPADPLGHDYRWTETGLEPTCTEKGTVLREYSCARCGYVSESETVELEALGHDWDSGTVSEAPTCLTEGIRTFTCSHDCSHTYTETIPAAGHAEGNWEYAPVPAEACTEAWTQKRILRCRDCGEVLETEEISQEALGHEWGEDGKCTRCGTRNPETPSFVTHSILLGGAIGVNFYTDLSLLTQKEREGVYVEFTVNGEPQRADFDPACFFQNPDDLAAPVYHGFTCYVSSVQMADEITAVLYYTHNGEEKTIREKYSVMKYTDEFMAYENSFSANTVRLVKALADYGHYVQPYLADANGWTLNVDHTAMDQADTYTENDIQEAMDASSAYGVSVQYGTARVKNIMYSLSLDSETAIHIYVTAEDDYAGPITASALDGDVSVRKLSARNNLIELKGIPAHKLGQTYDITINAGGECTVSCSAMSYVNLGLHSSDSRFDNDTARFALTSLYRYYQAACEYRDHPDE